MGKARTKIPQMEFKAFWNDEAAQALPALYGSCVLTDMARALMDEAMAQCFAHVEKALVEHGLPKEAIDALEEWRAEHRIDEIPGRREWLAQKQLEQAGG